MQRHHKTGKAAALGSRQPVTGYRVSTHVAEPEPTAANYAFNEHARRSGSACVPVSPQDAMALLQQGSHDY